MTRTSSATPARSATTWSLGSAVTHELHFGYQIYLDSEDLTRSSNGWGEISVPGGRLTPIAGTGQSAFYTARFQQQTGGAASVIHSKYRSQSIEANDTIRWKNWTFNAGLLASNDTLYGQGLREDKSALSGFVAAPGNKYNMYEIPFSKMLQPRLGRDVGVQRPRHHLRQLRQVQPGGQFAAPRRIVGSQPDRHLHRRAVRCQRRAVRHRAGRLVVGQAVRGRPDAANGQRVPRRHGAAVELGVDGAALRALPQGQPFLGRHEQQRPDRVRTTARDSARALHPGSDGEAGPDRQRVDLRDRRARRRLHQLLRGDDRIGMAGQQVLRARLLYVQPLLRQLRPGQLVDQQRRQHLHRVVEHRRRRRASALEHQGRDTARRPPATC